MLEKYEKKTSIKSNHIFKEKDIESMQEIFDEINISDERNVMIW
jgi:hypothetical protein